MQQETGSVDNPHTRIAYHVDELSDRSQTSEEYFVELLSLLATSLEAHSGCIWQIAGESVEPMVQSPAFAEGTEPPEQLRFVVQQIVEQPHSTISLADPDPHNTEASRECCLLVPLCDHHRCFGVISLDTYAADDYEAKNQLALVESAAARVQRNFLFQHLAHSADRLAVLEGARQVTDGIGKYVETKPLAFEVVSRLRNYFECDRVSLLFRRGQECSVKAISNQPVFDRRSNSVRSLEKLSAQVVRIEEPLWFPQEGQELVPSLTSQLNSYFEVSNAVSIGIIPLFAEKSQRRDDPEDIAATIKTDAERRECIGVLVVEGFETPVDKDAVDRRWARVEANIVQAIANARKYEGLFLMPLWQTLGTMADWYRGHTRRKALLITGAILLPLVALGIVPADFKLRGEGNIQPVQRQHVYAQADGVVDLLEFEDGQTVTAGERMIRLKNPELSSKLAELEGKLREAQAQLETYTLQRVTRAFDSEKEQRELVQKTAATEARITGLEEQVAVLRQSLGQLNVTSPITGEVVSWDTHQRLNARPVKRGDRLMTVAVLSGDWEVDLRIPDKRAGYLLTQWQKSRAEQADMPVSFVIASNPTDVFHGIVSEVSPSSDVDQQDKENVVRVRIRLTPEQFGRIENPKPGTTVIGHIHCGRASIGYCKLYEFFDFIKRQWFKFVS